MGRGTLRYDIFRVNVFEGGGKVSVFIIGWLMGFIHYAVKTASPSIGCGFIFMEIIGNIADPQNGALWEEMAHIWGFFFFTMQSIVVVLVFKQT